jgi:hypothetical protein
LENLIPAIALGGAPMPVWLSQIFGREGRISKLYDPQRFTRFDFLIVVICIAFMVLISGHFSLWRLAIVTGCVVVVGLLTYTPAPIFVLLALCAAGAVFVHFANQMKEWQAIGILVFCAMVWLEYVVERMGRVILSRVDEAHRKLDALRERIEEIEAKQDEDTRSYVNPIDL